MTTERDRKRQVDSMFKTKGKKHNKERTQCLPFQNLIYVEAYLFILFLVLNKKWKADPICMIKHGVPVWLIAHSDVERSLIMHQCLPHCVEEHHHSR